MAKQRFLSSFQWGMTDWRSSKAGQGHPIGLGGQKHLQTCPAFFPSSASTLLCQSATGRNSFPLTEMCTQKRTQQGKKPVTYCSKGHPGIIEPWNWWTTFYSIYDLWLPSSLLCQVLIISVHSTCGPEYEIPIPGVIKESQKPWHLWTVGT